MNDHDLTYLRHIRDAIYRIEEYVQDVSQEAFFNDQMRQDAVIRQLSVIGETAGDLSDELRETYPSVPWDDVYGMRNKLVHDYFGVDLDAVSDTIRRDLHPLLKTVESAIQDLENK